MIKFCKHCTELIKRLWQYLKTIVFFWLGKNVFQCVHFLTLSYSYFLSFCFLSFFRLFKQLLSDGICRISSINNQPDIRYPAKPYLLLLQEFIKWTEGEVGFLLNISSSCWNFLSCGTSYNSYLNPARLF